MACISYDQLHLLVKCIVPLTISCSSPPICILVAAVRILALSDLLLFSNPEVNGSEFPRGRPRLNIQPQASSF